MNAATRKPGIYLNMPNEDYHAGPGISKSGLWTISQKTPAHYRHAEYERKNHLDLGDATHIAILEPEDFEKRVHRGPVDRRGNKCSDLVEASTLKGSDMFGKVILTESDYDSVLTVRDAVHANSWLNGIISGGKAMKEASGYFIDQPTSELCRVRPDLYREDIKLILDIKTTTSAHPDAFAKAVTSYGYHAQEAFYTDGWNQVGKPVEAWAFLALEKFGQGVPFRAPFAFAVYELPPSIVEDGRVMMRKALDTYHTCRKANAWPSYGEGVQELSFKKWAYRETEAPEFEEAAT